MRGHETIDRAPTPSSMSISKRFAAIALGAVVAIGLTACSTPRADAPAAAPSASDSDTSPGRLGEVDPAPPEGDVTGQGTVMDRDGGVELCVGVVFQPYPPQCDGIPLEGWQWDAVDGEESAAGATWGEYAVTGTFDGERVTVTQPAIPLALYDPIRPEDPTGGVLGRTAEADLTAIQEELRARLGQDVFLSWLERGYLWLQVVWDDGTLQEAADAEFGEDVIIVEPALRQFE